MKAVTATLMTIATSAVVCAAAFLPGSPAAAGDLAGSFTLGTGYLDNPLGTSSDTPAGYLAQSLRLAAMLGADPADGTARTNTFKLGYEGSASQFGNDTSLGNMRHGAGLEWFHTSPVGSADPRTNSLSAGAQFAIRGYEDYYGIYDYSEFYSYLAFRRHAGAQVLWSGFAALRMRRYGELPEESYLEPHAQVKYQRFFAGRTTLGLSARYGNKIFNDSVASAVWGTPNLPSTSQAAARLELAQGLSDRLSIRGRVDSRWTLSDFPYYVADDIIDSPLLDTYAHDGWDYFAALKWLGPLQVWTEVGASRGNHDYGSLLFATSAAGQTRDDTVHEYFLSLEKTLARGGGAPKLRVVAGWRDQDSTISTYTYDGVFASSTVAWQF